MRVFVCVCLFLLSAGCCVLLCCVVLCCVRCACVCVVCAVWRVVVDSCVIVFDIGMIAVMLCLLGVVCSQCWLLCAVCVFCC